MEDSWPRKKFGKFCRSQKIEVEKTTLSDPTNTRRQRIDWFWIFVEAKIEASDSHYKHLLHLR